MSLHILVHLISDKRKYSNTKYNTLVEHICRCYLSDLTKNCVYILQVYLKINRFKTCMSDSVKFVELDFDACV